MCPYALHAITKQKQIYDEMQHSNRIWHSVIQYDRSKYKCDAVNCGTQHNKIWLLVYSIHKQNQQSNFFWLNVSLPQWKKKNLQLFCFCIYVYLYVYVSVWVCVCVYAISNSIKPPRWHPPHAFLSAGTFLQDAYCYNRRAPDFKLWRIHMLCLLLPYQTVSQCRGCASSGT